MNNYRLTPAQGWKNFSKHVELVEKIYSIFIPLVNKNDWHYLNFASDTGSFEDNTGNSVFIEFSEQTNDEIEEILDLTVSIKPNNVQSVGLLESTMLDIVNKYQLEKINI